LLLLSLPLLLLLLHLHLLLLFLILLLLLPHCEQLRDSFLSGSIASSTARQYASAYHHWQNYCRLTNCSELPAAVKDVSNCVSYVASTTLSFSTAERLAAAISFEHRRNFLVFPTTSASYSLLMKSIKKQFSVPRSPKLPLTKAMIHQFLDHLYQPAFGIDGQHAP
jgi:hypothetical protein